MRIAWNRAPKGVSCEAIGKSSAWDEVYHGWDSSVSLGPFPVGSYEFMVRARNSIGGGALQTGFVFKTSS